MAHLFQVDYLCHHVSSMVESGRVLVVAESHDQAHDLVATQMNLPTSRTRFESSKIKPPIRQIDHRQSYPEKKPVAHIHPGERPVAQRYSVFIQVDNVHAYSENQAIRKVGEELNARGNQGDPRHRLNMMIECSPAGERTSGKPMSTLEAIEFYRPATKPMTGGRTGRR